MERKPNIKTNIAEKVHKYHKIVNVKSQREFNKKHGGLEHGLGKCLEIFFETKFKGGNKKKELRVYEIKNGKKLGQPFRCDWYAKIRGKHVVFEFNGNHHYQCLAFGGLFLFAHLSPFMVWWSRGDSNPHRSLIWRLCRV